MMIAYSQSIPAEQSMALLGSFAVVSLRLLTILSAMLSKRMKLAAVAASLRLMQNYIEAHKPVSKQGISFERLESDIEVKGVYFSYTGQIPIFSDLSMTLPKKCMIGIIGASGVGKSTLGYLLARIYEPQRGTILVNGRDYRDFSMDSLRRHVGYVEQEPIILHGTIEDNIRFGLPEATRDEIRTAGAAANLDEFVERLPDGYRTLVGDRGDTLSVGQRQRIAIARAIVRRPEIFIFDEATSALDGRSESLIQKAIENLVGSATVIVIAHRLSTLRRSALIYELLPSGPVIRYYEDLVAQV